MVYDLRSHANVTTGQSGFFSVVRPYPLWPIALPASESNMTRSLNNLSLAWSGALDIVDTAHVEPLWQTTDQAGLLPPEGPIDPSMFQNIPPDSTAPEIVAVAIDPELHTSGSDGANGGAGPGRMVVVANAMFLEDQFVNASPQNVLFAANAVDWLAQSDALIRIRSKNRAPPALTFASAFSSKALKWGNLVGIPILLALFGLLRIGGRSRRAIRRWEETGERG
jgi:ABC-2 type transport system permease protein